MRKKPLLLSMFTMLLLGTAFFLLSERFFHAALKGEIADCAARGPQKLQCYETLLLSTFHERGLRGTLAAVGILYEIDQEFASQCHGNLHEIGAAAYRQYAAENALELPPETTYCGFGFFHGFLEELVIEDGDPQGAGEFCREIGSDAQRGRSSTSCFHGIGHGVTDGMDPRLWGNPEHLIMQSLSICESIAATDIERKDCASGVFNSLALLYRNPNYKIYRAPEDPYAVCRGLPTSIPFTQACYDQMNIEVLAERTFREGIDVVQRTVEPAFMSFAINGLTSVAARDALFGKETLQELSTTCATLASTAAEQCIEGVVAGVFEFGKPGSEYEHAIELCLAMKDLRSACIDGYTGAVSAFYGTDMQKRACRAIAAKIEEISEKECSELVTERFKVRAESVSVRI